MRALLAFLLGFVVAVGGAFLRDSVAPPSAKPFVNWDVVRDSAQDTAAQVRVQWDRLMK